MKWWKWLGIVVALAMLSSLAPPVSQAQTVFRISVSPSDGTVGTTVTVSSSSAPESSPINIVLGRPDGTSGQVVAATNSDSQGRFRTSFVLGRGVRVTPGSLVGIWATANPGTPERVRSNVRVFAVRFGLTISPDSGPRGTRVTVSSATAPPGSSITVFVGTTQGTQGTAVLVTRANSQGRFQESFLIGSVGNLRPDTNVGIFAVADAGGVRTIPSTVSMFRLTRTVRPLTFNNLTPRPFTTVNPGIQQLGAVVQSDADIVQVTMTLNGGPISLSLGPQPGARVSAFTTRNLAAGTYTLTMTATDRDGDVFRAQWDFTVGAAGESQWFTAGGQVKGDNFNATTRSLVEAFRYHLFGQSWDGTRHPEFPTHASTITSADPLRPWVSANGQFDRQYTEATLRSLVEAFRWHLFGISWEGTFRPDMVTHATSFRGPEPIQPWFDSAGRPIRANIEATTRSLVEAMRWHFFGYSWDGVPHPNIPTHVQ